MFALLTLRMAGAERVSFDLAGHLASRWDVRIVALRDHDLLPPELSTLSPPGGVRELLFGRTDLLVTALFLPGVLARIRQIWDRDTPWVHTVHYHNYGAIRWGRIREWLDHRWVFPAADALVAAGDTIAGTMAGFPAVRNIPNGVELKKVDPGPFRDRLAPVVGTVAMLRPEKGLAYLVEAAPLLRSRLPGARIRIAGDGPMRASLEDRVRDLGVEDVVEFCGYMSDIQEFYRSLDIYLQPSDAEGFGIAALEAFRFAIPIVVTRAGNLPNLVGDGEWGIIVDHSEAPGERLASAMVTAWTNRDEWSARAEEGRRHWQSTLSVEKMVQAYEALFQELL